MKTLLSILALVASLYANDINSQLGYATDYATAVESAKSANKPLLIMVVSSDCDWCRQMENDTLADADVDSVVKEKMVAHIINKDNDTSGFVEEYPTPQVPTLYFVNAKHDELIFENLGYLKKEKFTELVADIVTDYHEEDEFDEEDE